MKILKIHSFLSRSKDTHTKQCQGEVPAFDPETQSSRHRSRGILSNSCQRLASDIDGGSKK